jgi:hypothetical protein
MNKDMRYIILFLSVALTIATLPCPGYGAYDGGVVSPILSYNLGSRGYAMGGAYTALVDDSTAVFWNPAGLAQIHRQEVNAYFETLFVGSSFWYIGYSYPIWNLGVASGSIMYLG